MNIEKGMYVRTDSGVIDKIIEVKNGKAFFKDSTGTFEYMNNFKSSHNLIDLIEVGDCIKINDKIYQVEKNLTMDYLFVKSINLNNEVRVTKLERFIHDNKIQSIVTKEQFKANEYMVKE